MENQYRYGQKVRIAPGLPKNTYLYKHGVRYGDILKVYAVGGDQVYISTDAHCGAWMKLRRIEPIEEQGGDAT